MNNYRTKQPGDVLFLEHDLKTADSGFYVLLNPHADMVSLCRLGEDLQTGNLVITKNIVEVLIADLSCFQSTGLSLEISGLSSAATDTAVIIGDILEPINDGAALPVGLYQVISSEGNSVLVSRLHSNEDGKLATTARTSGITLKDLKLFRTLKIVDELRP